MCCCFCEVQINSRRFVRAGSPVTGDSSKNGITGFNLGECQGLQQYCLKYGVGEMCVRRDRLKDGTSNDAQLFI